MAILLLNVEGNLRCSLRLNLIIICKATERHIRDKGVIKEVIKAMVVEEGHGRSSMSFVGGGMNQANVGMKANHGHVATVVVTTLLKNVDNRIK